MNPSVEYCSIENIQMSSLARSGVILVLSIDIFFIFYFQMANMETGWDASYKIMADIILEMNWFFEINICDCFFLF